MPNNVRAQQTRARAAALRVIGLGKRPRKRLPRQIFPKMIELDYARALVSVTQQTEVALEPLLELLPLLLSSARSERERLDAGESERVAELIAAAEAATTVSTEALEGVAEQFAQRVSTHQRIQLSRQVTAALGVDVFTPDIGLAAASDAFVAENVALIKDLPRKTLIEIQGIIQRGVTSGALHGDIAKQIQERLTIAKNRAKLIARDQVGKFYGNVQKQRQQAIGVTEFIWRTVADERVRDTHAALDGQQFKWSTGAAGEGIPGEPINCRCYAEPVLTDLI